MVLHDRRKLIRRIASIVTLGGLAGLLLDRNTVKVSADSVTTGGAASGEMAVFDGISDLVGDPNFSYSSSLHALTVGPNNAANLGDSTRGVLGTTESAAPESLQAGVVGVADKTYGVVGQSNSGAAILVLSVGNAVPIIAKAAPRQDANLQEWQDSSGTVLSSVDSKGNVKAKSFITGDMVFANGYLLTEDKESGILLVNDEGAEIAKFDRAGNLHIRGKVTSDL